MKYRQKKAGPAASLQLGMFDNVALGIQESTAQVPCGDHSMADPSLQISEFTRSVYWVINHKSNWHRGESHALSCAKIAKILGVKSKSQVHRAIKWLCENGWLSVMGKRGKDGAFFYKVTHHNCDVDEIPLDKHQEPLKCAVPSGVNSPFDLLEKGLITWRVFNQAITNKINSDWITGVLSSTLRETKRFLKFGMKTISENVKTMLAVGLLKRTGQSEYEIKPSPYPKRRKRQLEAELPYLPLIKGWYYSFNKLWRFNKESFLLQKKELGGKWRDASMHELQTVNAKIHFAFTDAMHALRAFYEAKRLSLEESL